jgi:hypothetical protein
MAGERRQCRRAGIPTEMVELVSLVGHRYSVDDLTERGRARFVSMTASASGFEKSGLSNNV